MTILQPTREALEGISLAHTSRYKMSSEKDNCSNTIPCCPADSNFGMPFLASDVFFLFIYIGAKVKISLMHVILSYIVMEILKGK